MPTTKGYQINARNDMTEILMYDDIGEGWFGGISAKAFVSDLNKIKTDKINLRINSEGGSVFEGNTIYNALKRHKSEVIVDVDGLAASIASLIAMAGDEIRMAENAIMMIHDPWSKSMGNSDDHRKSADLLDKVKDSLVSAYQKKTGMDEDKITAMMAEETWMDAAEAADMGFADTITDELKVAAHVRHKDWFTHAPDNLVEQQFVNSEKNQQRIAYMKAALKHHKL